MATKPHHNLELIDAAHAARLIDEEALILALSETAVIAGDQAVQIHLAAAYHARELLDAHEVIADRMANQFHEAAAEAHFQLAGRARQLLVHHLDLLNRTVCGG